MMIDDGFEPPSELRLGQVEVQSAAPSSWDGIRAVLWLPDPEQRHGWREFYVRAPEQPKPGRRAGF